MSPPIVSSRVPGDLIAMIPSVLGHHPQRSAVILPITNGILRRASSGR